MNILTPAQVVDKKYLREEVNHDDVHRFCESLRHFYNNHDASESEEYNKNLVRDFLKEAFYHGTNAVNTYGYADMAIYGTVQSKGSVPQVLIEAKSAGSADMVDHRHLNRKALHELILYYLREEVGNKNTTIKHLVITDGMEWYVFEKRNFLDLFALNRKFVKKVLSLDADPDYKTQFIYSDVIKPFVAEVEDKLQCTYFSLRQFKDKVVSGDGGWDARMRAVFKFLSPVHLLRQSIAFEHNQLNRGFYEELLYIMGLEEVKDSATNLLKIKRATKAHRQNFSLMEQSMLKLADYGLHDENERFELALDLVMEWVSRILFLKLLEAQLREADSKSHPRPLLCIERIPDFGTFYNLCMLILAKPYDEREPFMNELFPDVPYLNSSLFELTDNEKRYFSIDALLSGPMRLYGKTAVKTNGHKMTGQMPVLEYLLRFLNSYHFGSSKADVSDVSTIINAAVLGLIFEKINGYKDGAFFTPSYVTEYMCRDVIRQTVVQRFNEAKGWSCENFEELKGRIDVFTREQREEGNVIVNSISVCDPAVGSGHFLVSALNELLLVKAELGLLQDHSSMPRRLTEYSISVADDELILTDEDGKYFRYIPSNPSLQRVQETLFEEKRIIIENCLFGVDLNHKSVEICRLRLWIELLKHAYYYKDEKGVRRLQTLPNIDINIKHGNSLLSKYHVRYGRRLEGVLFDGNSLAEYRQAVAQYKNCDNKRLKAELRQTINCFKHRFLAMVLGTEYNLYNDVNPQETLQKSPYQYALEWGFEFPEILSEDGCFQGFDIVIGNPPYVSLEEQRALSKEYAKMKRESTSGNGEQPVYTTYDPRGDLYILFVERAFSLLKPQGLLSFIIPNKWMRVGSGRGLRRLLTTRRLQRLVDFRDNQVFPEATTYTCIINMKNEEPVATFQCCSLEKLNKKTMQADIEQHTEIFQTEGFSDDIWVVSSWKNHLQVRQLRQTMSTLGEWVGENAYYGIKTGLTEAFLISQQQYDRLIAEHASAETILRPFVQGRNLRAFRRPMAENYLLFLPKGFTLAGMGIDAETEARPDEATAWKWLSENYPSVANHLHPFAERGRRRTDKGDYWWELRACTYYDKFERPKILYQVMPTKPCFVYDNSKVMCNNSVWFFVDADKRMLALLNSSVAWWLMMELCPRIQNGCQLIGENLRLVPVPAILPPELAEYAEKLEEAVEKKDEASYQQTKNELDAFVQTLYSI